MKLIIAGGRDYRLTRKDIEALNAILQTIGITEVFSGGCPGVDREGEAWAYAHGLPVRIFQANWDEHGKEAGPIRNEQMAKYAEGVVLFPGGKGTESMYRAARKEALWIHDFRVKEGGE